ncbi:PEP-CTERM protein-sorting domain-containing protein [Duganella sp. CF402]|uniref:PEP-CTERM sorting domain-containing protein n=1 Tax=unclassified Duganella TaxID=2636909 RepID=UPI0008D2C438|nr:MULTISPECIES: PEP-CTERM sorting domain-containing protein [unclassified Duganella]RZT10542.1 putative secreted protein with PEP-CTERM sorting signal [Duganella sp. BK701]SEL09025.1 PEP-CTERM protein-sorting domain-containing protein [Duganella sp. CF402]
MKHTIFAAALALASLSAHAHTIGGLYNTGLGQGATDAHYNLSSAVSNTAYISTESAWPINDGTWLHNSDVSKWITPLADQATSLDPSVDGIYTYTLSFDLTGYNASTASFSGHFAADNSVVIKLNGAEIASGTGFKSWLDFGASSGFASGVNTLEFVVTNDHLGSGNPTGLRVEFAASNVSAVPEPATYGMLLGGLALVGAVARRRKQK